MAIVGVQALACAPKNTLNSYKSGFKKENK
jgi:hypothetical protein